MQKLHSEPGPHLRLFSTRYDQVRNPRNGLTHTVVVLEGNDAAQVVALTPDDKILLVRQYRFGIGDYTLELPGGMIDAGEAPEAAARRELREETGHQAEHWRYLGRNPSNPVFMSAYVHHFAARGLQWAGAPAQDPGEDIRLEAIDRSEVRRRLLAGEFEHPHTVCALLAFFADSL